MSELELDRKLDFLNDAVRRMAEATFGCICSLAGVETENNGALIGTGFRVGSGSEQWLVTANHVVEQARARFGRLAVAMVRGEPPQEVQGQPLVSQAADVAVFRLAELPEGVGYWCLDSIEQRNEALERDFIFVHGFPGETSHVSPSPTALTSKSLPYGAMLRGNDLPSNFGPDNFALDFQPSHLKHPDGVDAARLDPHGLSGSPVWRIGVAGIPVNQWSPACAKLVGVLTEWRPEEHLLVGVTADCLFSLLK